MPDGLSKPYLDSQGRIWVKHGSDKRYVTAREEIQRLFQRSELIYADVIPVECTSTNDLDGKAFDDYLTRHYGQSPQASGQPLPQVLQNIGLGDGQELNLARLHHVQGDQNFNCWAFWKCRSRRSSNCWSTRWSTAITSPAPRSG